MIKILHDIPHRIYVAFSGGVDSLVVAHFLKQGRRDVELIHFNHGCEFSAQIEVECRQRATDLGLPIHVGYVDPSQTPPDGSQEAFWRKQRYTYLRGFNDAPVVTCHHLDDAVETWVWSSLHGEGKLIPYQNRNVIRPFLLTKKADIQSYAERQGLVPVDDPMNNDLHAMRNYMRANMMGHIYHINPGIDKVIRKKYLQKSVDKASQLL